MDSSVVFLATSRAERGRPSETCVRRSTGSRPARAIAAVAKRSSVVGAGGPLLRRQRDRERSNPSDGKSDRPRQARIPRNSGARPTRAVGRGVARKQVSASARRSDPPAAALLHSYGRRRRLLSATGRSCWSSSREPAQPPGPLLVALGVDRQPRLRGGDPRCRPPPPGARALRPARRRPRRLVSTRPGAVRKAPAEPHVQANPQTP